MSYQNTEKIDAILKLSMSEALQGGKFKDFVTDLMPSVCKAANAFRTSFWLYRSEKDEFESIQSYDAENNLSTVGQAIERSNFADFIEQLKENRFIHVDSDNDTAEFGEFALDYLVKNRLRSWASIQVWNDNRLFGVLAIEWQGKKDFVDQDQLVMIAASSMISQCYDALLRLKEDFLHRSEVSSLKVEEKEKEKLARKLSDHAFYTSHSIRHPLSTILALIDLIKLNWESREAYEELLQQLKIETMNLDDAIRVMTAKIELD